ncbi:hypothetical protein ACLFMI_13800 [Pseudonocardia nantongensis]|uniref:hypothetical protein n=1 Tax=Pseudonocardia nantongensis TaxID=1181885 RepID=UPI003977E748
MTHPGVTVPSASVLSSQVVAGPPPVGLASFYVLQRRGDPVQHGDRPGRGQVVELELVTGNQVHDRLGRPSPTPRARGLVREAGVHPDPASGSMRPKSACAGEVVHGHFVGDVGGHGQGRRPGALAPDGGLVQGVGIPGGEYDRPAAPGEGERGGPGDPA